MATRAEIEALKAQWLSDSCWDIENTAGFEGHYDELLAYRKQQERERKLEREAKIKLYATSLGIPEHFELAEHILKMEAKVERMQHRIDELENRTASL